MELGSPMPAAVEGSVDSQSGGVDLRAKSSKTEGEFSGDVTRIPRVEPWMAPDLSNPEKNTQPSQAKSYKEALKPQLLPGDYEDRDFLNDTWDGSLLGCNQIEMEDGIVVTDSSFGPHLAFTEAEKQRLERKWSRSLIVKLLGGTIGYMQLRRRISILWGKAGKIDLMDIGNGFHIVSFHSIEDYYFALEGGPWIIQGHYLTVQTWKRNFTPWNESIQKAAIWVRLPGLPGDYYDRKFFFNLGNRIGKAIRVDEMTLYRTRSMYARMCVEVDLNAPLLPSYSVDGNTLKIEYEGLHLICFSCGIFGHSQEFCPSRRAQEAQQKEVAKTSQKNQDTPKQGHTLEEGESGIYGGWMVAQDPRRGRRPITKEAKKVETVGKGNKADKQVMSSRYAALVVEEVNPNQDGTQAEDNTEKTLKMPLKEITNEKSASCGKRKSNNPPKTVSGAMERNNMGKEVDNTRGKDKGVPKEKLVGPVTEKLAGKASNMSKQKIESEGSLRNAGATKGEYGGLKESYQPSEKKGQQDGKMEPREIIHMEHAASDGLKESDGGTNSIPHLGSVIKPISNMKPPDLMTPSSSMGFVVLDRNLDQASRTVANEVVLEPCDVALLAGRKN